MKTIGILYNPRSTQAPALAEEIAAWVEKRERRAQVGTTDSAAAALPWKQTDLVVTVGGDGSLLRTARAAAPYRVPILGVNMGRVGFLTETEPAGWRETLSRALVGDYWIEERMMLTVIASRGDDTIGHADALNDVVVGRGARGRVVHLHTAVDGGHLTTYVADGLIVATPTGSTAYALAAGGPVLPPQLRNIVLVPVAPHLSMDRPIVLAEGITVRITVAGGRPAVLTVDGEITGELESGDEVTTRASPHVASFARVQERTYFYKTLVGRLSPQDNTDQGT